jgi:catechol 2,3-dioxygenase-like lactoylglutathione lyase family enzyme
MVIPTATSIATLTVNFISPSPQPNSQVDRTITVYGDVALSGGKFLTLGFVSVAFGDGGPSVEATIDGVQWHCTATIPQNVPIGTAIAINASAEVAYVPQGFPSSEPESILGRGTLSVVLGQPVIQPPLIGWGHFDLTLATGSPAAVGEPFGYFFAAQGTEHVNYRDAQGHICELYWDTGGWHFNDLTAATGAPLAVSDPHGYVFVSQGTQHVNYRGADNHVYELWTDGSWHYGDLTVAAGAPLADSDPNGYVFDSQGTQHVNYRGPQGHIYELWWDGNWHWGDLTAAVDAQAAAVDPHGYVFAAQNTQHVNHRGIDNHVYELWWDSNWHYGDLTVVTSSPNAAGNPFGYMYDSQGTQHVNYRGADGHIYELWWDGSWHYDDLTAMAPGSPQAAGDPQGYAAPETQQVYYRGTDGHVHELRSPPNPSAPPAGVMVPFVVNEVAESAKNDVTAQGLVPCFYPSGVNLKASVVTNQTPVGGTFVAAGTQVTMDWKNEPTP